jgi:hypothetical protein
MYRTSIFRRSSKRQRIARSGVERPVFPLPALDGEQPTIAAYDEHNKVVHLSFAGKASARFENERVPVYAFKAGEITSVTDSEHGRRVFINHQNGCMSECDGLDEVIVKRSARCRKLVKSGDVIGYLRSSRATLRFTMFEAMARDVPGFPIAFDSRTILCFTQTQFLWSSALIARAA